MSNYDECVCGHLRVEHNKNSGWCKGTIYRGGNKDTCPCTGFKERQEPHVARGRKPLFEDDETL